MPGNIQIGHDNEETLLLYVVDFERYMEHYQISSNLLKNNKFKGFIIGCGCVEWLVVMVTGCFLGRFL
jgi:hypothetical protein